MSGAVTQRESQLALREERANQELGTQPEAELERSVRASTDELGERVKWSAGRTRS